MNKKILPALLAIACTVSVFTATIAVAEIQRDNAVVGQSSDSCAGTYYAMARMTNSTGGYWLTPPANSHTGTFKDISGLASPYSSSVVVVRKIDQQPWCTNSTNGITFPATNSSYSLTVYVNSQTPPPTNNQALILQVTWQ